MKRILLLGKNGQLGWELRRALVPLGQVFSLSRMNLEISDFQRLRAIIQSISPDVILNATAYNDVDAAESNREIASLINGAVPLVIAQEAHRLQSLVVHYSTDYVFDGKKASPYKESDICFPINYYGYTKHEGEKAICEHSKFYFVFRTSWMYSSRRDNFLSKVLRWAREHETLRIVDDQIGSPTWARMLAELTSLALLRAFEREPDWLAEHSGIYHLAGSGAATRFEWAQAILELDPHPESRLCRQLLAAKTADFPTPAQRPAYSALDCAQFEQTFGLRVPPWRESLELALDPG